VVVGNALRLNRSLGDGVGTPTVAAPPAPQEQTA
jgi:hypothetical protein